MNDLDRKSGGVAPELAQSGAEVPEEAVRDQEVRERLEAAADEIREAIYRDLTGQGLTENVLCTALARFDGLAAALDKAPSTTGEPVDEWPYPDEDPPDPL